MLTGRKYQGWTLSRTNAELSNHSAKTGFYKIEFQEFKTLHGRYSIYQQAKKQDLTFTLFQANQSKKAKSNKVSDLAFRNSLLRSKYMF